MWGRDRSARCPARLKIGRRRRDPDGHTYMADRLQIGVIWDVIAEVIAHGSAL